MTTGTDKPRQRDPGPPWNSVSMRACASIEETINRTLSRLSTADKNRVLLSLHQLIADQLDALATTTHD
jgi:hypothetical protein